jgi:hypothetical protein
MGFIDFWNFPHYQNFYSQVKKIKTQAVNIYMCFKETNMVHTILTNYPNAKTHTILTNYSNAKTNTKYLSVAAIRTISLSTDVLHLIML